MPPPSPAPDSKRLRAGCRLARLCATIWRETGAKRGDFPLQTATIGARSERVDTEKSITYPLCLPFPRVGVGYRLMLSLSPSPPAISAAGYFQSPEAKSAEPQNRERPALGCCLSSSIQLDFW